MAILDNEETTPGRQAFEPLRVPKAAELVAGKVRTQIVRGELSEGDALPTEGELMKEFGVSRPTLREALRVLESQSLISVHRGSRGGARVRVPQLSVAADYAGLLLQMSDATVNEVLETRLMLEVGAVRMLAEKRSKAGLADARAALAAEAEGLDDLDAFREAAASIHRTLVRATGNKSLILLYGMLEDIATRHTAAAIASQKDHPRKRSSWRQKSHQVHSDLIDLVEAGDADGAERLWRAHVALTNKATTKLVGAAGVLDLFE